MPDLDIGDVLFRNGRLDFHGFQFVHRGDQVAFLNNFPNHFLQLPGGRGHDAGGGTRDFDLSQLLLQVAALSFEPGQAGFDRVDFLGAASGQQQLQSFL